MSAASPLLSAPSTERFEVLLLAVVAAAAVATVGAVLPAAAVKVMLTELNPPLLKFVCELFEVFFTNVNVPW